MLANNIVTSVREVVGRRDAVLEFRVEVDGIVVNSVDLIRWNEAGRIIDLKVMVRSLREINLLHAQMRVMLESMRA